jgi:hypothetical protein
VSANLAEPAGVDGVQLKGRGIEHKKRPVLPSVNREHHQLVLLLVQMFVNKIKPTSGVCKQDQTGRSLEYASEQTAPAALCGPGASEPGGEGGGAGGRGGERRGAASPVPVPRAYFLLAFFPPRGARGEPERKSRRF